MTVETPDRQLVPFTGWESDEFVTFVNWVVEGERTCTVEVVGREPILATPVRVRGRPLAGYWEGYRRVIQLQTGDGTTYEVGGSNSTRPIASTIVTFEGEFPLQALSSTTELLRTIESADDAGLVRVLVGRRVGQIGDDVVAGLLESNVRSLEPGAASIVLRLLGTLEDIRVIPLLTEALSSEHSDVRRLATLRFRAFEPIFKSYGEHAADCARAINALSELMVADPDWEIRTYAAEDLGYFNNDDAVAALQQALFDDDIVDVRWAAAIALGRTTAPNAAPVLLAAGLEDTAHQVRRACLLGLSRLVPVVADAGEGQLLAQVADFALANLSQASNDTRDFAAALIGELAYPRATELLATELILDCVIPSLVAGVGGPEFATKATSAYALGRYVATLRLPTELRTAAEQAVVGETIERSEGWPESAYQQWYLSEAAELLSRLESHDRAATTFRLAAERSSARPWSAAYLRALSDYERGEAALPSDPHDALRSFAGAVSALSEVYATAEMTGEEAETLEGIDLKKVLAQSRAGIVEGVLASQTAGRSVPQWQEARSRFDAAANALQRVDLIGLEGSATRQLTRAERSLIMGMLAVTELGSAACQLWLALHDGGSEVRSEDVLDDIDSLVRELERVATDAHADGLVALSTGVGEAASALLDRERARASRYIQDLLRSLVEPMPRPGMCPLLASGQATLSVNGIGAVAGDGSHEFPFEFIEQSTVALDVTVAVARRGRGDVLRFCVEDAPLGCVNTEQVVQVHENYFSLRPVELETAVATGGPRYVALSLAFQTTGCRVETDRRVVWFQGIRQLADAASGPSDEARKLHESIQRRERQIRELEEAINLGRNVSGSLLQLRQLQADLSRDGAALDAIGRKG